MNMGVILASSKACWPYFRGQVFDNRRFVQIVNFLTSRPKQSKKQKRNYFSCTVSLNDYFEKVNKHT